MQPQGPAGTDYTREVKFIVNSSGGQWDWTFDYQDASNFYMLRFQDGTGWTVFRVIGGSFNVVLGPVGPTTYAIGAWTLTVQMSTGSGHRTLAWFVGVPSVGTYTDTSPFSTGTLIGYRSSITSDNSTGIVIDQDKATDGIIAPAGPNATAYTLTGPPTAATGIESVAFIVTPNGNLPGTITPSDASNGGTFTPSSLTWAGTSEAKRFTYTPASSGTKTISTTNTASLPDPSSLSLVVTDEPATLTAPTDLVNCIAWHNADASAGVSSGQQVSTSTDQSGAGHNFTESGAARPTYLANQIDGRGAYQFSGAQSLRGDELAPILQNSSLTFAAIIKHSALIFNPAQDNQNYFILTSSTSSIPTRDLYTRQLAGTYWSDNRDDAALEISMGGGYPDLNAHGIIYTFNLDTGIGTLWVDGTIVFTGNHGGAAQTVDIFTVGAHRRVEGITAFLQGLIGEFMVWDRALTTGEVTKLFTLLRTRWTTPSSAAQGLNMIAPSGLMYQDSGELSSLNSNDAITGWADKIGIGTGLYDLAENNAPQWTTKVQNGANGVSLGMTRQLIASSQYWSNAPAGAALAGSGVPFSLSMVFKLPVLADERGHPLWVGQHW